MLILCLKIPCVVNQIWCCQIYLVLPRSPRFPDGVNASGSGLVVDKRTSCIGPLDSLERKRLSMDHTLNRLKVHAQAQVDSHSHTLADTSSKGTTFGQRARFPVRRLYFLFQHRHRRKRRIIVKKTVITSCLWRPPSSLQFETPTFSRTRCKPPHVPSSQRKLWSK